MDRLKKKRLRREKVRMRVRARVRGTAARPRLSVFRSNRYIYAQLIDDDRGYTLAAASSLEPEVRAVREGKTPTQIAFEVGRRLAERALAKGISKVVFDRNGYLYHGRVKALAEGAREGGLRF
ncbi:MAG: 50S ribosomal protein L18 [Bacteroidetes bacterium]|nr:50S ribosomal protein L18 [Rhodothermia bacterium]MCS7154560.1 50S ribosomal protein L18 [Bacteroidota bacterium]MCX7906277.1 50S ribosomal protein L18 [Bacteroidota bacterium]MDW8137353.1 50S ribosomal protein L18 [Bacteroidota bacterium]MDW8285693.1 50S ribosomal protein L18 [Bacteroidota bacterium]